MQLSAQTLKAIRTQPGLTIPGENLLALPEKVLQFGTGVLLRALPDYFIDKANRQGIFNGRIVVVKSTANGATDAFDSQDGLYSICVKGLKDGKEVNETIINASISRVVSANDMWPTILEVAHNPDLQIIISNTTEVGITLTDDRISQTPPPSFPGKLLAFLYERFKAFKGSPESGLVIIPTELIINNADKLRSIILEMAERNNLEPAFSNWLQEHNNFCNSLVDRIVPGKLPEHERLSTEQKLGYTDELMIMAEEFRLWAIESSNERVKQILSFAKADNGVVIAPDIEKFRELKLRLLNGTHTFSCGLAHLAGFRTVKEAMANEQIFEFVHSLALQEIADCIIGDQISREEALAFGNSVLDRFRNPFLEHYWMSISVQSTSKMKLRNIPLLLKHYSRKGTVPDHMSLGFAGYLLFMKCSQNQKMQYVGFANGSEYIIQDDCAEYMAEKWSDNDIERVVDTVLADEGFWGADLANLPGFADTLKKQLRSLVHHGVLGTLQRELSNKTTV